MLKSIEEYGKYAEITGFRNVHIKDAKALSKTAGGNLPSGCEVQLFDADIVATWEHLYFAAVNALMNQKVGRGVSQSMAVETALYASAQRQIKKALELVGMKPETRNAAALVICGEVESAKAAVDVLRKLFGKQPDESVLELSASKTQRIKRAFEISEAELQASIHKGSEQALVESVLERVALLSTRL